VTVSASHAQRGSLPSSGAFDGLCEVVGRENRSLLPDGLHGMVVNPGTADLSRVHKGAQELSPVAGAAWTGDHRPFRGTRSESARRPDHTRNRRTPGLNSPRLLPCWSLERPPD
jgi:hypothetical protein